MARKLRIQFENAIYHVINRGNYRQDVFSSVGAAKAFEVALAETCDRFGWQLFAYVIMRNHFHLAVGTPRANLVEGMHWLQGTFATRFNRLRSEQGHLFQGRYQALLVEDTAALVRVVNYIHLNPVRAGIVTLDQMTGFRWSSLRQFVSENTPSWLVSAEWREKQRFADSSLGWKSYVEQLVDLAGNPLEQERQEFPTMSRGWAIGTAGWRRAIAKDHADLALTAGIADGALQEIKSARCEELLKQLLSGAGKRTDDITRDPKSAEWKIIAAQRLRDELGAGFSWISANLNMGSPASVRVYLCKRRKINN
jgi:putative transposase